MNPPYHPKELEKAGKKWRKDFERAIAKDPTSGGLVTPVGAPQAPRFIEKRPLEEEDNGRGRPEIYRNMFYCRKCKKTPEQVAHYGASARMGDDGIAKGSEGYMHVGVNCHGETVELVATFAEVWATIDKKEVVGVFDSNEDNLPNIDNLKRLN